MFIFYIFTGGNGSPLSFTLRTIYPLTVNGKTNSLFEKVARATGSEKLNELIGSNFVEAEEKFGKLSVWDDNFKACLWNFHSINLQIPSLSDHMLAHKFHFVKNILQTIIEYLSLLIICWMKRRTGVRKARAQQIERSHLTEIDEETDDKHFLQMKVFYRTQVRSLRWLPLSLTH